MQRITMMAIVGGLIAVMMGIVPAASSDVGNAGNSTAAFDITVTLSQTVTELLPLGILALVAGAILKSTGILKRA